jgi:hypothetical protein
MTGAPRVCFFSTSGSFGRNLSALPVDVSFESIILTRFIHDPLRLVDFPPPFSAEANS